MGKNETLKGIIISDFTTSHFTEFLNQDSSLPSLKVKSAPFGQVSRIILDDKNILWKSEFDLIVVWTQPEKVINSFKLLLEGTTVSTSKILKEVDQFVAILKTLQKKAKTIIIPIWVVPSYDRGLGMINYNNRYGISNILARMNLGLADALEGSSDIFLLDTNRWTSLAGENAYNSKLWYMAKIPFSDEVFHSAVSDIKAAFRGILGQAKKILLLDLDDTLWGGIVGDLGWENIKLGGHDPIGEAFSDFQRGLKVLKNRGVLLGLISKNEEENALAVFKKNKEMILHIDDLSGWKINWQDKAKNIVELVGDLNLGLNSVVFIDDNPVERAWVREALPDVTVPDWPEDKLLYKKALVKLPYFDFPTISKEDRERTKMYVFERKRNNMKNQVSSLEDWLKKLKIKVIIEKLNKVNLPRATQLLNKTNQMNLTTRRLTEEELWDWAGQKGHFLYTFRVSDKFGDSGLTGIASFNQEQKTAHMFDFILSCRVMGRKVEETMLYILTKEAKKLNLNRLEAKYLKTAKNKPCFDFFLNSGFKNDKKDIFFWELDHTYPLPSWIKLT